MAREPEIQSTKIAKAGLTGLALELHRQHLTEQEIADRLNDHVRLNNLADPRGKPWAFSQSTVHRTLAPFKEQYRNKAKEKLDKFIDAHIESDLLAIQEAEEYHMGVARDKEKDYRTRSDAFMKTSRLIFEKVKAALGGPDEADIAERIATEVEKNLDPALREKLHAVTSRANAPGLSRPH